MLAALAGAGIEPDLVLGTSIGGINGAFVAAHPVSGVTQLGQLWQQDSTGTLLGDGLVSQLRTLRRTLISLHSNDHLESLLSVALGASTHIEDLPTPLRVCRLVHRDSQRHLVRARTPRPGVSSPPPPSPGSSDRWSSRDATTSTVVWSIRSRLAGLWNAAPEPSSSSRSAGSSARSSHRGPRQRLLGCRSRSPAATASPPCCTAFPRRQCPCPADRSRAEGAACSA